MAKHPLPLGTVLLILMISVLACSSIAVYFLFPLRTSTNVRVSEGGVAIIDALSELNPNPQFEEAATRYLNDAGMYVDIYNSSRVSVDFMKSFPAGYNLVIFRVHSGTGRDGVFYFTSELYDESKYQPEQFRDELRPGKDYEGHPQVFTFGAKFVNTYLRDRFRNAIIIGMGCFGGATNYGTNEQILGETPQVEGGPNMAEAFHLQGASAIIGWDKLVSIGFSDQGTLQLISALALGRLTVRQAVDKTNQEFGPDPTYKSILTYYPVESGDHVLRTPASQDNPRMTPHDVLSKPESRLRSHSGRVVRSQRTCPRPAF